MQVLNSQLCMRTCVSWKVRLYFNGSAPSTFRMPAVSTQIIPENINKITSYNFPSNFNVSEVEKFDLWYYNWLPSSERNGFAQEIFSLQRSHFLFYSIFESFLYRSFSLSYLYLKSRHAYNCLTGDMRKYFQKWKDLAFKILFKSKKITGRK